MGMLCTFRNLQTQKGAAACPHDWLLQLSSTPGPPCGGDVDAGSLEAVPAESFAVDGLLLRSANSRTSVGDVDVDSVEGVPTESFAINWGSMRSANSRTIRKPVVLSTPFGSSRRNIRSFHLRGTFGRSKCWMRTSEPMVESNRRFARVSSHPSSP